MEIFTSTENMRIAIPSLVIATLYTLGILVKLGVLKIFIWFVLSIVMYIQRLAFI